MIFARNTLSGKLGYSNPHDQNRKGHHLSSRFFKGFSTSKCADNFALRKIQNPNKLILLPSTLKIKQRYPLLGLTAKVQDLLANLSVIMLYLQTVRNNYVASPPSS